MPRKQKAKERIKNENEVDLINTYIGRAYYHGNNQAKKKKVFFKKINLKIDLFKKTIIVKVEMRTNM